MCPHQYLSFNRNTNIKAAIKFSIEDSLLFVTIGTHPTHYEEECYKIKISHKTDHIEYYDIFAFSTFQQTKIFLNIPNKDKNTSFEFIEDNFVCLKELSTNSLIDKVCHDSKEPSKYKVFIEFISENQKLPITIYYIKYKIAVFKDSLPFFIVDQNNGSGILKVNLVPQSKNLSAFYGEYVVQQKARQQ